MEVTSRGATTTVAVEGRQFKITYSPRWRRLQIREHRRLIGEAYSFQSALEAVDKVAKRQYN
jgi:hypothetical protein